MWFRNRQQSGQATEAGAFLEPVAAAGPALPPGDGYFAGQVHGGEAGTGVLPGTALRMVGAPGGEARSERSYPVAETRPARTGSPSRNLVQLDGVSSAAGRAYSRLGARLMRRLEENGWSRVAITAPQRRVGTGSTAVNLATSLAHDFERTVILVEFDVVNPSLCARLGFAARAGVVEYLRRDAPLGHLVFDAAARLVVLPAGGPDARATMLLASAKMGRMVETLRARYENAILIFDVPPWLVGTNPAAFTRLADCILLVVEEDATRMEDVRRAVERLKPAVIAGVVLNSAAGRDDEDG